jgi:hypothetical protein
MAIFVKHYFLKEKENSKMKQETETNGYKVKRICANRLYETITEGKPIVSHNVVLPPSLLLCYLVKIGVQPKDIILVRYDYAVKDTQTKAELRQANYTSGFRLFGITYKRLFRTVSKAKSGEAYFINSDYYDDVENWLTMGFSKLIKQDEEYKLVELEAYKSLTASAIIGTVKIKPSEILIINDVNSTFTKDVAVVSTDKDNHCIVDYKQKQLTNVLFDGQALIDDSLFNDNSGMAVLRNHFFKCCGFRTDIQSFMKDYCSVNGYDYNKYQIRDMFGTKRYVKNIKLITSNNAIKWIKFSDLFTDKTELYRYWQDIIAQDGYIFGIVKNEHASKFGNMQRMSYQMINSLPLTEDDIKALSQYEMDKITQLKTDDSAFLQFLKENKTETNGYDLLADLIEQKGMINNDYVNERRKHIISNYVCTLRKGKIEITGDNFTVVQNPVEMLYSAVHNYNGAIEFKTHTDHIEVCTERFPYNTALAGFRSPHNAPNNVLAYVNVECPLIKKYCHFGNNVIVINGIETDVQQRASGQDQDGDAELITDNALISKYAKQCYQQYPTILNDIQPSTKKYTNNALSLAEIDTTLADSQMLIGQSSNLAQIALSYYWSNPSDKLKDDFIILSVLAQLCIDSAKKNYNIDLVKEVVKFNFSAELKNAEKGKKMNRYPSFFQYSEDVGKKSKKKIRNDIQCPMNYLESVFENIPVAPYRKCNGYKEYLSHKECSDAVNNKQVHALYLTAHDAVVDEIIELLEEQPDALVLYQIQRDAVQYIKKQKINYNTMQKMIKSAFQTKMDCRTEMLLLLYHSHKDEFLNCFMSQN